MRPIICFRSLVLLALIGYSSQLSEASSEPSPEELSEMMEKFGKEIGGLMRENIDQVLRSSPPSAIKGANDDADDDDEDKLARMRRANEMVAKDTESRIAAAGRASTGELGEFSLSDAYASGKDFFVNKVSVRLQQAGSYLGSQMSQLTNLAPSIKEKLRRAPAALRRILSWPTFFNFKVKFNKVYKNKLSELHHQMTFLKTQAVIGIHNMKFFLGRTRHLQKTTQYADMSDEEYLEATGNDAKLANQLDLNRQESLSEQQLGRLRELRRENKNIFGGDMEQLLKRSKETSPAHRLAAKRKEELAGRQQQQRRRRKRDLDDELDDDDEEGPMYSLGAFEPSSQSEPMDIDGEGEGEDDEEYEDDEMEDASGNHEAELVDDFANGFQHVDLEAQMDAELGDDDDDGDGAKAADGKAADSAAEEEDEPDFTPIDWSEHRCMPIIENQEACGFCYALVASTLSDFFNCMWSLKDKADARPRRLSGRFVSDCGRYMYSEDDRAMIDGCSGGIIGQAIKFIREAGIMSFFGYENKRVSLNVKLHEDNCLLPRPAAIKNWAPIQAPFLQGVTLVGVSADDWASANLFLHAAGPVIVNIRPWSGFKTYAGGIFDEKQVIPEEGKVHSMLIVGRDRDENGRVYYKLRNTHGVAWGERGYARIASSALKHYATMKGILMPL